jgi:hypothetical protein
MTAESGGSGLNGEVRSWVDTLTDWAVDLGFDTPSSSDGCSPPMTTTGAPPMTSRGRSSSRRSTTRSDRLRVDGVTNAMLKRSKPGDPVLQG